MVERKGQCRAITDWGWWLGSVGGGRMEGARQGGGRTGLGVIGRRRQQLGECGCGCVCVCAGGVVAVLAVVCRWVGACVAVCGGRGEGRGRAFGGMRCVVQWCAVGVAAVSAAAKHTMRMGRLLRRRGASMDSGGLRWCARASGELWWLRRRLCGGRCVARSGALRGGSVGSASGIRRLV